MSILTISDAQVLEKLNLQKNRFFEEYYAFYSSWYGGITKNPHLMLLPMDDHLVHRGDGVFEGMKAVDRSVYLFDEHMERLFRSAEKIGLKTPFSYDEMKKIIVATLQAADQNEVMIRIYLSRGPGNFSVNPNDSIAPQFYVMVSKLPHCPAQKYTEGVRIGKSVIPAKSSWLAQTKSCNCLPNVLMKQEALDRNLDYVVGLDPENYITESATENIIIVDQNGVLVRPLPDVILGGITMMRACQLAEENQIKVIARNISVEDLLSAHEVMLSATTLDILPVIEFEGKKIANGKPGDIAKKLKELLMHDIAHRISNIRY